MKCAKKCMHGVAFVKYILLHCFFLEELKCWVVVTFCRHHHPFSALIVTNVSLLKPPIPSCCHIQYGFPE